MSQAKVDKYKNEKANRKKTNARNKVKRVIARIVAAAAVVALVGWGGYSGYQYYEKSRPVNCYYADISAVSDYLQGLSSATASCSSSTTPVWICSTRSSTVMHRPHS